MSPAIDSMTVREAIYGRSSVRAYTSAPVDEASVRTLLAAAVRAPTAMHGEPWQFVVIQDRALLERLSERVKQQISDEAAHLHLARGNLTLFSQPGFKVFYDAGTLIVICAGSAGRFTVADCWLAAENLMLAAHATGLATCVIGSAAATLNLPDVKQELRIPPDTVAVAPIIVGVPRGPVQSSARKEPQIIAWH